MKLAAPPCAFKCYNKDNPTGSDPSKWRVSSFSFSPETGEISDAVSGGLYIDRITANASVSVTSPVGLFAGTASFVFPAKHWAFALDGRATLAERDAVTQDVDMTGTVAGVLTTATFSVTAEIESSGQSVYDDWSWAE
jgi:hypothetical protein